MTTTWRNVSASPHFRDGKFQNISPTPVKAENVSFGKMLLDAMRRPKTVKPPAPLPFIKTDLRSLPADQPSLVWFGHSSYLIHLDGINILIDPVFSGYASPIAGMVKAFPGSNNYTPDDMPPIDILILTHNHYDHFDKDTVTKLQSKVGKVILPLGVGPAVAACGIDPQRITELDWWETAEPMPGIRLTATPARHFSGRGLKRAGSLWTSYVLKTTDLNLFLGGDSGYDSHFKQIGEQYGPFDLAILECGQYNLDWPYIHMMPEQTAQAAQDLKAGLLLPVHWAKFTLASHPWNEPIQRVLKAAAEKQIPVTTPLIGQLLPLKNGQPKPNQDWWNFTNNVTP